MNSLKNTVKNTLTNGQATLVQVKNTLTKKIGNQYQAREVDYYRLKKATEESKYCSQK